MQYMTSFNNSAAGGTSGSVGKNYKTHVSSSQKNRQYHANQSLVAATVAHSGAVGAQVGIIST